MSLLHSDAYSTVPYIIMEASMYNISKYIYSVAWHYLLCDMGVIVPSRHCNSTFRVTSTNGCIKYWNGNDRHGGLINKCQTILNTATTMILMMVPFRTLCPFITGTRINGKLACLANCLVRQPLPNMMGHHQTLRYKKMPCVGLCLYLPGATSWMSRVDVTTTSEASPRYLCLEPQMRHDSLRGCQGSQFYRSSLS
jgi:hypothetical protein